MRTTQTRWQQLDGLRSSMLDRLETYAGWTLPVIFPDENYDQRTDELADDFQSLGAQLVNHLSNKIMLAGFRPSQPFFRIDMPPSMAQPIKEAAGQGDENAIKVLAAINDAERQAIKVLDSRACRPTIFEVLKHLIITGNVLLELGDDYMLAHSVRDYVVHRNAKGKVIEVILKERVHYKDYDEDVQRFLLAQGVVQEDNGQNDEQCLLDHFTHVKWDGSKQKYRVVFSAGDVEIPGTEGFYNEDALPYRALTWTLPSKSHYGIGLVEEYAGDFGALSMLSEAQIKAAILASEFRFLVNPAGQTSVLDFQNSENGDAIPGTEGDIAVLEATGGVQRLQALSATGQEYIQRLGRGFLLSSAVTRDSERTTAEEIRMQINELETSLGGAYTRLAVSMQKPIAYWLLHDVSKDKSIKDLDIVIVTGLDALSRAGDLENLRMFFARCAELAMLPPEVKARLNWQNSMNTIAAGCGVSAADFMVTEQQAQQNMQQYQQQMQDAAAPTQGQPQ